MKTTKTFVALVAALHFGMAEAAADVTQNVQGKPVITITEATPNADVVVKVQVGGVSKAYAGRTDGVGVATIVVEEALTPNRAFAYEATVGAVTQQGAFFTGTSTKWFSADPSVSPVSVDGGVWTIDPSGVSRLSVTAATEKIAVVEQEITFTSAIKVGDIVLAAEDATSGAAGAITLAEDANGSNVWMGFIGGGWVTLAGVVAPTDQDLPATRKIRFEYNTATKDVVYYVNDVQAGKGVATGVPTMAGVSYIGDGKLGAVLGTIEKKTETATLPRVGGVTVNPAFAVAVAGSGLKTPDEVAKVLESTPSGSDVTVAQAYALGATVEQVKDGITLTVRGEDTQERDTLRLVDGLKPRTNAGVTVKRKVKAGTDPNNLSEIEPKQSDDKGVTIALPTTGDKVRYFKIAYSFE